MLNYKQLLLKMLVILFLIGCGGSLNNENENVNDDNGNASTTNSNVNDDNGNASTTNSNVNDDNGNASTTNSNVNDDNSNASTTSNNNISNNLKIHNQGRSCLQCHNFTTAGTIFTKRDAANYDASSAALNHTLRLVLENGSTVDINRRHGNEAGNVYTTSNLNHVGTFTAQVLNSQGVVVNSSNKLSHDDSRFDCNRCHTPTGNPARIVNFKN